MSELDPKEAQRKLMLAQLYRLKNEKYKYYEPSGKGEEFINYVSDPDNFITLFSAGNGIGKTATGANIVAHICFGKESTNPYFQQDFFNDFPHPKRGRIVSDPTNISKNIIPQLKEWFPKGRYVTKKDGKNFESIFITDTGMEFDLMTYEQAPREFEGVTLGWAWLDEPPPEVILKAIISRMRKGGVIFITATPLAGSAYLYDMFAKGSTKVEFSLPDGTKMITERKVKYLEADIWSASKSRGIRGHLEDEDIMRMIAEYDEDERQARIYGKFQHLVGMVFKKWDRNIHVIPPFHVKNQDYSVIELIDPHPRNPDAIMWVATDRNGTKYVVDELFIKVNSDEELAERIKAKASQYRVVRRLADPSLFITNQHDRDGKSLADRLADQGLHYVEATKSRAQADRRIQEGLNYTQNNGFMIKAPEFYVFETCQRTIWEMEHYRWDEWTGRSADKKNRKERPIDKDDHMIENLGRALIQEPQFQPIVTRENVNYEQNYDPYL